MFYKKCHDILINEDNNYNNSLKKCLNNFTFIEKLTEHVEYENVMVLLILSTRLYLVTMFLLCTLLTPTFIYIIFFNNSSNDSNKPKEVDQISLNQIEIQIRQNIYIKYVIELYPDSFNDMNESIV